MAYFPMFIEMKGKKVLVIGGGAIAARRVKALLDFGCEITVLSPDLCEELAVASAGGKIRWQRGMYNLSKLEAELREVPQPVFVLAAAPEHVNRTVAEDCHFIGIPVNNASDRTQSDFYFPGLIKEGEAVIGVTSGGKDHKLAAALSGVVRTFIRETWKA